MNRKTQKEIDELWAKLTAGGGQPGPCGWLEDKFGLSWQVVPTVLEDLMKGDPQKSERVMAALMKMGKIDIETLEAAAAQVSASRRAAFASRRVESSVGSGASSGRTRSGISVQASATASQPRSASRAITQL